MRHASKQQISRTDFLWSLLHIQVKQDPETKPSQATNSSKTKNYVSSRPKVWYFLRTKLSCLNPTVRAGGGTKLLQDFHGTLAHTFNWKKIGSRCCALTLGESAQAWWATGKAPERYYSLVRWGSVERDSHLLLFVLRPIQ